MVSSSLITSCSETKLRSVFLNILFWHANSSNENSFYSAYVEVSGALLAKMTCWKKAHLCTKDFTQQSIASEPVHFHPHRITSVFWQVDSFIIFPVVFKDLKIVSFIIGTTQEKFHPLRVPYVMNVWAPISPKSLK